MTKDEEGKNISSSEDEMFINNVKDVIDQQFLNDDLYNKEKTEVFQSKLETNQPHGKSLRVNSEQEDTFMNFGISATFQNFVAKKLDKLLEGTIKLKDKKNTECSLEHKRKEHKSTGIKLLSTSTTYLNTEITEAHADCGKKFKRKKYKIIEDDDALLKFREAAVDSERILSKSYTEAWVNRRPEPDFKYKRLKNGILVEQA
ncbi:uncharacterized protein LOC105276562 isoform X2 [Ooceraea biroi]|uniref:uncharacterized protein LOC105276562 isoform X2 n=1 Tax=Ooceraea biroi TaxID=2015173 RepID=UPI0005BCF0CF|nr:uncharacterized protein LOC105276562 isoform X2 [Ooceraea biroi]